MLISESHIFLFLPLSLFFRNEKNSRSTNINMPKLSQPWYANAISTSPPPVSDVTYCRLSVAGFTNVSAGLALTLTFLSRGYSTSLSRAGRYLRRHNLVNPRAFVSRASGRRGLPPLTPMRSFISLQRQIVSPPLNSLTFLSPSSRFSQRSDATETHQSLIFLPKNICN